MSRSFKKHPVVKDGKRSSGKGAKRYMNRAIRRSQLDALPVKGSRFKDEFCNPWDRCDVRYRKEFNEIMKDEWRDYCAAAENVLNGWQRYHWRNAYETSEPNYKHGCKMLSWHEPFKLIKHPAGWIENKWFNKRCREVLEKGPPDMKKIFNEWAKFYMRK